jgi:hypothetical protein
VNGQDGRGRDDLAVRGHDGEDRRHQVGGADGAAGDGERAGRELVAPIEPVDDVGEQLLRLAELVQRPPHHSQVRGQRAGIVEAPEQVGPAIELERRGCGEAGAERQQ